MPVRLFRHTFLHGNRNGDGSADHGVVAHADQAHHLNVCGHGGGTCELSITMDAAQRVGQAIACGACSHVIGVQGTARAAAGSDREVLLAVLDGPLLVGAGNQMLEADGVGGVAGDGALNVLFLHDGNAFHNVVCTVALDGCALALREGDLLDDGQGLSGDVVLSLNIGEAVDTGNDVSCILAQAVQDDAQGGLADLVCGAGDADGTLSSSEGLVACQESEAGGAS